MLRPCVVQDLDNLRPFFLILAYECKYFIVFLIRPFALVFVSVEMVEPSLSTMFGSFENLAIRVEKERFGNLVPFAHPLQLSSLGQKGVL